MSTALSTNPAPVQGEAVAYAYEEKHANVWLPRLTFEKPDADDGGRPFRNLVALAALSSPLQERELADIEAMLGDGQGDDDGPQILPDFTPDMSTLAKVEACLHLLERRRDIIAGFTARTEGALSAKPQPVQSVPVGLDAVFAWWVNALESNAGVPTRRANALISEFEVFLAALASAPAPEESPTPDKEREDLGDRADALADRLVGEGSTITYALVRDLLQFLRAIPKDAKASGNQDVRDAVIEECKAAIKEKVSHSYALRAATILDALKHSPKAGQDSPLQEARRELDAENASFAEFEARAQAGQSELDTIIQDQNARAEGLAADVVARSYPKAGQEGGK